MLLFLNGNNTLIVAIFPNPISMGLRHIPKTFKLSNSQLILYTANRETGTLIVAVVPVDF
jgi:hypothetical protein